MEIAGEIVDLWPHADLPPKSAAAWYPHLADLPADDVRAAVAALAAEPRRFAPTVGELRAVADPPPDWEEALAVLDRLTSLHGWYDPQPRIDDPALARWVNAYGWRRLCEADLGDPTFRAQFRDSYRRAVDRVRAGEAAARAQGRLDAHRAERAAALESGRDRTHRLDVHPDPDDDGGTSLVPREAL